ncbi:MAG: cysteine desulfurase NifS [Kiritimatiellae bacterium]|jgi:cysteine desulfurase|nr:cysteine desulfurase NifS [Kiritimatiellia bacterium]
MSRLAYLDNNATTQVAPEVLEEMLPFFKEYYGNPSSMHAFGGVVQKKVDAAREKLAALLHADPSEIIFTSCGSESDNTAIFGTANAMGPGSTIITTRVEHPAVLQPCRKLKELGYKVFEIGVHGDGTLDMDEYKAALSAPGKKLVTMMWANNETGVIFPIKECAELAKAAGAYFHTDAVQAMGKLTEVNVAETPVDMLSLSGHKLHAPKGIGALYVRKGTHYNPFLLGGHQENGRRAGTENVPYIVGLGKAAELAKADLATDEVERIKRLRDKLQEELLKLPDARLNGSLTKRLPNTLNISFEFIEGEALLYHLSDAGICASSGSACSSGSLEPSHVIRAMGIPFTAVHGSLRFSLSRYNTEEDINQVIEVMPGIVDKLRKISPFVNA